MPIYEFACADCGTTFEKRVSFSAVGAPPCENCHSENVERLLSAPAIHFKGSGWYITDSKKSSKDGGSGKNSASGATTNSSESDSGSAETSSEKSTATESTSSSSTTSEKSSEKSTAKE